MATVPANSPGEASLATGTLPRDSRRQTSHLKQVPDSLALRDTLRRRLAAIADELDKLSPPGKEPLEAASRALLAELDLPEGYVGWTMVALVSSFWREQVMSVPFERRLLLLPVMDEIDPDSPLGRVAAEAHRLGYRVSPAEGSQVLKTIVTGQIDAILGIASLDVLEKAIDKILLAGIPCMATPLLSATELPPPIDEDWALEMIRAQGDGASQRTRTYVHLMRAATRLFDDDELHRLAPRLRSNIPLGQLNGHGVAGLDPVAGTEAIAYDFLCKGGKHSRPFITLAAFDALRGGVGASEQGAEHLAGLPPAVLRTAMSIETFHKASLVHDDIEDDDEFRYGEATLHRKYGTPTAINVGDYLIGLGYRLVSRDSATLGSDTVADILDRLADAHMKLSEGQGAELLWRDARDKRLTPRDALQIYALKTAPAFEAALYAGLRLAGPVDPRDEFVSTFSRHLGIAFQIINDLGDWRGDSNNKLLAGGDVLGGRPTVLWALALEHLCEADRDELIQLADSAPANLETIARVRELYERAEVFNHAYNLVDKHQQRAEQVAASVRDEELRRLLFYLVDAVLARNADSASPATTK